MRAYSAASSTILALIVLITIITFDPAHAGGPWYVTPGGDNGDDCLSPVSSCATINGAIAKAGDGDIVYVATGTYLDAGDQVVFLDKSIHISGGWNDVFDIQDGMSTIDGEEARPGIRVDMGVSATVEHLAIQNGLGLSWTGVGGGGIHNEGTLTVSNSFIRNNNERGIRNMGDLTLNDSEVSRNGVGVNGINGGGGGIDNRDILTITHSTISDNVEGGITNGEDGSSIVIYGSTVNDNIGTGIRNFSGCSLVLNNSTISGNMPNEEVEEGSIGGGIENSGILILNNTTVSNNRRSWGGAGSGGIWNKDGTTTLKNSILGGNYHFFSDMAEDCIGTLTSAGYNIVSTPQSTNPFGKCTFLPGPGDLLDIDPMLFPLMGTPGYHPLFPGNPATNGGNPAGCTDHQGQPLGTDQRGVPRFGRCDIGSYEYNPDNDPLSYNHVPLVIAAEQ